jgi:hypothetical protein
MVCPLRFDGLDIPHSDRCESVVAEGMIDSGGELRGQHNGRETRDMRMRHHRNVCVFIGISCLLTTREIRWLQRDSLTFTTDERFVEFRLKEMIWIRRPRPIDRRRCSNRSDNRGTIRLNCHLRHCTSHTIGQDQGTWNAMQEILQHDPHLTGTTQQRGRHEGNRVSFDPTTVAPICVRVC